VVKGYETEIANLKKEIEQLQETTQVRNNLFSSNSTISFSSLK
jgi:hypothetical protein